MGDVMQRASERVQRVILTPSSHVAASTNHLDALLTRTTWLPPRSYAVRQSSVRHPSRAIRFHAFETRRATRSESNKQLTSLSIVLRKCAGVPRRTAVAAAAGVGAVGSLTTLALAYREPLNRCRCGRRKDKDDDDEDEDERASTSTPCAFWPRAHCARCRKRTPAGVAMSFLFSPAYVAVASGVTALAAHVVGTKSIRAARAAASAVSRFVARRRRHSSP